MMARLVAASKRCRVYPLCEQWAGRIGHRRACETAKESDRRVQVLGIATSRAI